MEIKRFKISEDVLTETVKYLTSRPYGEVSNLVLAIQKDVEFLEVEDLERPIKIGNAAEEAAEEKEPEEDSSKPAKSSKKKK